MESLNDKILARCEGEIGDDEIIITNLEIIEPTSKVYNKVISLSPKQMMSILNKETNIIKRRLENSSLFSIASLNFSKNSIQQ